MITNANSLKIGAINTALPNMSETIKSWFQPITFGQVKRTNVNADWIETITDVETQGVVQPLKDEALKILPEGQRFWQWQMIHCLPNLDLQNNEYIYYKDLKYKVMDRKDFTEYGYKRYIILEAFRADSIGG